MPVVPYKAFDTYLKKTKDPDFAQVYLLYGEDLFFSTAYENLLCQLLPGQSRALGYEPFDGGDENIARAISSLNTFSLLGGKKVVGIKDTGVFHSKKKQAGILEKAKKEVDAGNFKKASTSFLSVLGLLGFDLDDLSKKSARKKLSVSDNESDAWLDQMIAYCKENNLVPRSNTGASDLLQKAVEKGFPSEHYLLITTGVVDKRKTLYKAIVENGVVVDCSIPKGERHADKAAQETAMRETANAMLEKAGKSIRPDAFRVLIEMTGFDLRTLAAGIEKLIHYIGKNNTITADDVKQVLERTKKDPIFEFTNALAGRSMADALFYMNSLLNGEMHPLQILAAMINQVRKLVVAKGFAQGPGARVWSKNMAYQQFSRSAINAVVQQDEALKDEICKWEKALFTKKMGKAGKGKTDLVLAKNPKSAYPVYQTLLKSDAYSKKELLLAMNRLSEADVMMKSTGQDMKLILEKTLISIILKPKDPTRNIVRG